MVTITEHTAQRASERLATLINAADVQKAIEFAHQHRAGKFYLVLAQFEKVVHLPNDPANVNGDGVVAVIKDGKVATFMLTKLWRAEYFSDGTLV
jgi:hypothetical protein